MRSKLIIVGGGEHARVVAQVAGSRPDLWELEGFVDPQPCGATQQAMKLVRLGADADLLPLLSGDATRQVVLGVGAVGATTARRQVVESLHIEAGRWASVIDASARVSPHVRIGRGVVIMPGCLINCGAVLDDHCIINSGAIIEHDVNVGSFAQVGPGATIGGGTVLGVGCYIGLGACLRDHITVGDGATVGMGAAVIASVAECTTAYGVPARVHPR